MQKKKKISRKLSVLCLFEPWMSKEMNETIKTPLSAMNERAPKKVDLRFARAHVLGHSRQNTWKSLTRCVSAYIPNLNSIGPAVTSLRGWNLEIHRWAMHVLARSDTPLLTAVVNWTDEYLAAHKIWAQSVTPFRRSNTKHFRGILHSARATCCVHHPDGPGLVPFKAEGM